jgi:hypothetical protein
MFVGSSKVMFGLAVVVVPVVLFVFAALAMVATSWRNWFGLQKKDEKRPKETRPHRTPLPPRGKK